MRIKGQAMSFYRQNKGCAELEKSVKREQSTENHGETLL